MCGAFCGCFDPRTQPPLLHERYVAGEFVGGSDIMIEMYNNGELAQMIEVANAS